MMMAGLAQATSRVKVWATIHTLLQNPAVAAKMIATLDQISGGRAGLNVVTGAYKGEFAQMGPGPKAWTTTSAMCWRPNGSRTSSACGARTA
jgi:pyrimidine oxygenase